jgi:hypothetical protein
MRTLLSVEVARKGSVGCGVLCHARVDAGGENVASGTIFMMGMGVIILGGWIFIYVE